MLGLCVILGAMLANAVYEFCQSVQAKRKFRALWYDKCPKSQGGLFNHNITTDTTDDYGGGRTTVWCKDCKAGAVFRLS